MVRSNFEKDLEKLNQDILKMGSMVEEAIHKAVTSLVEQDFELADQVMKQDDKLDRYELKVDKKCIKLIALQQPVARDLRQIGMIAKIATDLERMGDLAYNIARITKELSGEEFIKPLIDIPRMAEIVQEMVREALESFVNLDAEQARKVGRRDDEVDELDDQIIRELLTYMMEDPTAIKQGNKLMFVSRYLERIGDHITNICEKVVYIVTAERVTF
ncbi:phosphate signaling complex protein PhoU [Natroniella sulfidigena]|uniref:phosphate signaling complex protein PhoU n=1 Tax=Natroniella sulfidigena TaxID=723921 RepID=UPI00200B0B9D|nr:phosphate signaling complex protein PhoU [Natroniella sulfidigena]MCK8817770.1 phosphate signaling complex protein PhoU [Natroniella sulfidigena]